MLDRVDQRAELFDLTDHAIGKAAGHPDCVRNLRRLVKSGKGRGWSDQIVSAVASVLQCAPSWLRSERGAPEPPVPALDQRMELAKLARLERRAREINRQVQEQRAKIKTPDQTVKPKKSKMR